MRIIKALIVATVLAGGITAQQADTTAKILSPPQIASSQIKQDNKGLAKQTGTNIPANPKSNWSKIKDLFL